ncbi:S8 family serine peptidase [Zobellia galactanivorans]|uniref:S8 family serine peptidase n=1 Tax=Zobellia galactanivorans (strain DSM 12802 / CCUG 47099 / CIP 106680 / NCIMB 13871 / Dsij) TaxID=63186 RepID=UPI0026E3B764|nr:S8 family serine peptidase [Zobellia galactanivorans]MDO6808875.1 S8 family serine peptidase [Zobellia galactanivorans]
MNSKRKIIVCCLFSILNAGWLIGQERNYDRVIKTYGYQFDPLTEVPKTSESTEAADTLAKGPGLKIIQFLRPLSRKEHGQVKKLGLKLNRYLSGIAYVEYLSPTQLKELQKLQLLRWSGAYRPEYKIQPGIGQKKYETRERRQMNGTLLSVDLTGEADVVSFSELLGRLNAENIEIQDLRKDGFGYRVVFKLANTTGLREIASFSTVIRIFEVPENDMDNGSTAGTMQSGASGTTPIWNNGIRGENQIIHVKDTELDINHCFFIDNVDNTPGPDHRKVVNSRGPLSGTNGHGTFVAGTAAGDDINNPNGTSNNPGMAFNAQITFSGRSSSTFLSDLIAAKADGAYVHTNSWHNSSWSTNGTAQYDQTAFDADDFLWNNEDHIILGSAGNNGEELGAPGTAKNAICVGATQDDNNETNFGDGNTGPSPDGRRKPEMFTVGCAVVSPIINTTCTIGSRASCATSYSTPALAGAAALIRQYYQEGFYPSGTRIPSNGFTPTGALMKATLLNSTVDMTGVTGYPSNQEGWGGILMDNALFFAGDARNTRLWDVRHSEGLFTGETHTYGLNVAANGEPLKISMVYTDAPGTADSDSNVLTNDLDLLVTAPDGTTTFFGNDFSGGQSTTGGTADSTNNAEMVLVTTPEVGVYTIQVIGTSVNVGQPGQGYALVASGDFVDPPVPSGTQNTLVVRLREPGGSAAGLPTVQNRMDAVNSYIQEASYGQTSVEPLYFPTDGSIALDFAYTNYYQANQNPLIEMTEEVIDKLLTLDPDVFDRGTADLTDDIDRLVFVINSPSYVQEWATTGPWPYDLPTGLDRPISVSVNSIFNDEKLFAHNLCNQLGIWNLHAHPGVVFDSPHMDDWDLMAKPLENVGLSAWSKELVNWISDQGSTISFVARPAGGSTTSTTIGLNDITSTEANGKGIAIGLTPGAGSLANETVYFMLEARRNGQGDIDDLAPENGVLLYRVNENIGQGEGPVRIVDTDFTTPIGNPPLEDAALTLGESIDNIEGTGLDISIAAGTGDDYDVTINYDPPETDNDVRITVGDPHWTSPDIWIDSQKDGFDENEGRTPMDRGDEPVTGEVNRIYVRINNPGDGDAFDFDVFVRVSEPYHTVGGNPDFNIFVEKKHFDILTAGDTQIFYVNWIPNDDGDPHSCIKVKIPNVFNDVNPNNNDAQQNTEEVASTTASPYTAVNYNFKLTNPKNYQALYYFRPEGIPDDWVYTLTPRKALLDPGQRIDAVLTLQPPIDAPVCTDVPIRVSSWEAKGNTLIPLGGGSVNVQLRHQTDLNLTVRDSCNYKRRDDVVYNTAAVYDPGKVNCGIVSGGCTNPPMPFTDIVLKYITEDGYPFYKTVTTDEFGCFSDFFETVEGGLWEVEASFFGEDCQGPATIGPFTVNIPTENERDLDGDGIPDEEEVKDGDGDGDGLPCLLDPDCDGDGIPDGQEDPDCMVNPDCDGNGTPDGRDKRKLHYGFELGSSHPLANYSDLLDANVHAQLDLIYPVSANTELQAKLGFHQFTGEPTNLSPHPYWLNASLNAARLFPITPSTRWFARAGAGAYWAKGGGTSAGINAGLGIRLPLNTPAQISAGADYHRLFGNDIDAQWFNLHLGIIFTTGN